MIRGDFCNLTEEELNDLSDGGTYMNDLFKIAPDHNKNKKQYEEWCKANEEALREANIKECDWYSSALYGSMGLRSQAIQAGYRIKSLYPIYHQGWEMDEWGATGFKDGKYYVLETSHGGLCTPYEIKLSKIERVAMNVLKIFGLE